MPGPIGVLDDSIWTPPVRITETPKFSPVIRGRPPQPGIRRGTIVVPRPPENTPIDELLVRDSAPLPVSVVNAIWTTLTHQDQKLASYSPMIFRGVEEVEDPSEPTWISAAIQTGIWSDLIDRSKQSFVHVEIEHYQAEKGKFRIAFVLTGVSEERIPELRVFGFEQMMVFNDSRPIIGLLRLPDPMGGQRIVLAVAYDVDVTAQHTCSVCHEWQPLSVLLNAAMIINAPSVNDGREVVIERNIPEAVTFFSMTLQPRCHEPPDQRKPVSRCQRNPEILSTRILMCLMVNRLKTSMGSGLTSTADEGALMRLNADNSDINGGLAQ